jgi:hypothetical protein
MRKEYLRVGASIPLLLVLLAGLNVFAQELTGSIKGTLRDESGAIIADANVVAINSQRKYETKADQDGVYSFASLPPGTYTITVTAPGFGRTEKENILVELGRTLQVNMELRVGEIGEVVTITGDDLPIVDLSSSKTSVNITERQITVLPKDLSFASVIAVAPGTRSEGKAGGFQIDGASGSENIFVVDGVEITGIISGTLGGNKNIPLDFIKEVQVKSAGYEAEYGGATGGVINVVTKSGSNDYHGEARLEYTSEKLVARSGSFFRIDPLDPKQQRVQRFRDPNPKTPFRFLNPTFTLSGPIIKDRLWFFTSYTPQLNRSFNRIELISTTPAPDGSVQVLERRKIETSSKSEFIFTRLDFALTDKISVYATFISSPTKSEGGGFPGQTASRQVFSDPRYKLKGGYTPASQTAFGGIWNILPNLIFSFRGGYTYLNDKGGTYDVTVNQPLIVINAPCPFKEACGPGTELPGNPTIQTNNTTLFDITKRTNLNFDATYITRIGGQQHIFKGGYQTNRISNEVESGFIGGIFNFFFDREFAGQRGKFGYYVVTDFGRTGKVDSSNQGIFIQDAWSINPRVVLNLGLRLEKEFIPAFPILAEFHPGIPPDLIKNTSTKPIDFGFGDKVAPRIGGAWDVLGNGKLKISGSFSFFFDTFKYELPRGSFGGEKFLRTFRKLDQPDFRGISLQNQPGDIIAGPFDFRFPSTITLPGARPLVDPDIKPFRSREYSAAVDYAIRSDLVIGARFTRKKVDRAIEDVGGVDAKGNEVFTIGNPGFGVTADPQFFSPPTPKAVREYTGLELRLDKRFSNNWYLNISYIYSKLFGNYSGLASSDEGGRTSPNVNRFFDLPELNFDSRGRVALGRLATDRPNTFKAFGAYRFSYRLAGKAMDTEVGGSQQIFQGITISTIVSSNVTGVGIPILANGRGDLGRPPVFTQTDLVLNHFVNISDRVKVKFSLNVFNLFSERNATDINNVLLGGGQVVVYKGLNDFLNSNGDFMQRIKDQKLVTNPLYGLPSGFQGGRSGRLNIGIQF